MLDAGLIVLAAFISPFRAERRMVREMLGEGEFVEVFVDVPSRGPRNGSEGSVRQGADGRSRTSPARLAYEAPKRRIGSRGGADP